MRALLARSMVVSFFLTQTYAKVVTQVVQVVEQVFAEARTSPADVTPQNSNLVTVFVTVTATTSIDGLTPTGSSRSTETTTMSEPSTAVAVNTENHDTSTSMDGDTEDHDTSTSMDVNIEKYNGHYALNKTFAQLMLNEHNYKRYLHQAQMLLWNSTAFDYASEYASNYDCSGVLTHSGGPTFGENLAIGYSPSGAIDAWYNEGESYSYGTESTYNHFTALIWNSTRSMACAYKYCNEVWGTYIICSYYPPGNIVGQSGANVFPLHS